MFKFTPVILSLLAATAIVPPSFATNAPTIKTATVVTQPDSNLHAQLIINIGTQQRRERQRVRRRKIERQREIERQRRYSKSDRHSDRNRRSERDYRR